MNAALPHVSGETYFFRDHGQFDLLRLRLLPELIDRGRAAKKLRIWSAGCSSGEEAYSLAMLLDMLLPGQEGWDIRILGSDIDQAALAKARRGCYGQWSFRMVPPGLRQRYFRPVGEEWLLDERIRSRVSFRAVELVGEPFPGGELQDMDLILCRNVFIYFASGTVAAIADKLAATLRVGGYLMVGHTELIGHRVRNLQSRLVPEGVVYRRIDQAPDLPPPPGLVKVAATKQFLTRPATGKVEASSLALDADSGHVAGVPHTEALLASAHEAADRGEYELADECCRRALAGDPLAAGAYFLLAQLAQLKGDAGRAGELLDKTLYLDPHRVAAYLELAALCERADNLPRAQTLRRAALDIVRGMPGDAVIEPYETTATEMAQWLVQ